MIPNREHRRIVKSRTKQERKRFGLISKFQDQIREHCFIDNKDNLIVEVIENKGVWDWSYKRTVRIPVSKITTFSDIYKMSETPWKSRELPSIYFNYDIEKLSEINKQTLNIIYNDEDGVKDLFVKDNLCSYPLDSKLIRYWINQKFGLRSGFDSSSKWTYTVQNEYNNHIMKSKTIEPILPYT
ncbi:MAG: hypothetical protein P8O87_10150, partial [Crocinitomicaceae bacterium]|nr:hypothetical protein [Crocinitomicaceae bacterium]